MFKAYGWEVMLRYWWFYVFG